MNDDTYGPFNSEEESRLREVERDIKFYYNQIGWIHIQMWIAFFCRDDSGLVWC